jgi:hypothetical protein
MELMDTYVRKYYRPSMENSGKQVDYSEESMVDILMTTG